MGRDDAARRRLIAAALRRRLAEVGHVTASADGATRPARPADDPEESLRVTMVRLLPALRAESAGTAELEEVVAALDGLAVAARGGDLRYLDAWNNAYEALTLHPELTGTPTAQRM